MGVESVLNIITLTLYIWYNIMKRRIKDCFCLQNKTFDFGVQKIGGRFTMRIDIMKNEVVVNEKSIKIGGEIDSANAALNDKTCYDSEFYYENGDVLINIENDCISYIEIRNGYKSEKYVYFDDFEVLHENKKDVLAFLENRNEAPLIHEDEQTVVAQNLGIVIGLGISEEEVQELIRESKADGMYETMMEDIEKDIYRSMHIECIGIRKV